MMVEIGIIGAHSDVTRLLIQCLDRACVLKNGYRVNFDQSQQLKPGGPLTWPRKMSNVQFITRRQQEKKAIVPSVYHIL